MKITTKMGNKGKPTNHTPPDIQKHDQGIIVNETVKRLLTIYNAANLIFYRYHLYMYKLYMISCKWWNAKLFL